MKSRWFPAVAVLVPLSLGFLSACGDGKEKPSAAKATYIAQVDVVCKDVIAQSASIGNAQDEATARRQSDLWQDANNRIKANPTPGESVELARQFVTSTENLHLAYYAAANAIAANTGQATRYFGEAGEIRKNAAEVAKEYGFTECTAING